MPVEVFKAPTGGIDTDSATYQVPKDRAQSLFNMLPGRNGKTIMRGPIVDKSALAMQTLTSGRLTTPVSTGDRILATRNDGKTVVFTINDTGITNVGVTASVGIHTAGDQVAASAPGPFSGVFWRGANAAIPGGTVGTAFYGLSDGLYHWNGIATPTAITRARFNSPAIANHLGRIFMLSGEFPAGVNASTNDYGSLTWSVPLWNAADTDAAWQDTVTGLTNRITVTSTRPSYASMVSWKNALYIFLPEKILALYGTSPSNFTLRPILDITLNRPDSICVTDDAIYFLSDDGYMQFDGRSARCISKQVTNTIAPAWVPTATVARAEAAPNDTIIWASNAGCLLYDTVADAWAFLFSPLWNAGALAGVRRTQTHLLGWDDTALYHMTYVPIPDRVQALSLPNPRDTDDGTEFAVRQVTRIAQLAAPPRVAGLRKLHVAGRVNTAAVSAFDGQWDVSVQDEDGAYVPGTPILAIPGSATAARGTAVGDVLGEVEGLALVYDLQRNSGHCDYAEIHDAYLEWEPIFRRY